MKAIFSIFLLATLFCGCSQKRTAYIDQTTDVVAGKDIAVLDYVLNIKKRDGNSLEGIRMVRREPDGKVTIITADTGTITQSPKQSVETPSANPKEQGKLRVVLIQNSVTMTLSNANVLVTTQSKTNRSIVQKLEFSF